MKKCLFCNESLDPTASKTQRYCSLICRREQGNRLAREKWARRERIALSVEPPRSCQGCGITVPARKKPGGNTKKWCSRACNTRTNYRTNESLRKRRAELAAKRRAETYVPRPLLAFSCLVCTNEFHSEIKTAKYCSQPCANKALNAQRVADGRLKAQRQIHAASRKAWTDSAKEQRECEACSTKFMVYRYNKSRHCSISCGQQMRHGSCRLPDDHPVIIGIRLAKRVWVNGTCKHCAQPFTTSWVAYPNLQSLPQFCSFRCSKNAHHHNRRIRKRGAFVAPVYRNQIFERDNWTCQLCNEPIDRTVKVPHPLAVTLDHVIPIANGGKHEPGNAQCAHFICNSTKGNRVA